MLKSVDSFPKYATETKLLHQSRTITLLQICKNNEALQTRPRSH